MNAVANAVTDEQLVNVAGKIRASVGQFTEIYDSFVSPPRFKLKFLRAFAPAGETAFMTGLKQARNEGWLPDLVFQLMNAGAIPDMDDETNQREVARVELQGIVRESVGFVAAEDLPGVLTAFRRVCRIRFKFEGREHSGSGFLVGPQTILTSAHVVAPLLTPGGAEVPGSENLIFVDFDKLGSSRSGKAERVAKQWLVCQSSPHPDESPASGVLDLQRTADGFDEHLDYAAIRLLKAVGRERGYYKLDARRPRLPEDGNAQLALIQHPAGNTMHVSWGACTQLWPPEIETRLLNDANSLPGSSGGLLLDFELKPVGLHQCGYKDAEGNATINGAIPTSCIAARKEDLESVIGIDPVWRLDNGDPVFGRESLQMLITEMIAGARRILVVTGDPRTGKSFSTRILRALLGSAEHTVVEMDAANISGLPAQLASDLLAKVAGPNHPTLPEPGDSDTAQAAWITDKLFPALIEELRIAAKNRILWLVFDDLTANPIANTASRQLLEKLYREIASYPFLRVVLIGLSGDVPAALPEHVAADDTRSITSDDVKAYIERRATELGLSVDAVSVDTVALAVETAANKKAGARVERYASTVRDLAEPIFLKLKGGPS